jgi:hypothetical protein
VLTKRLAANLFPKKIRGKGWPQGLFTAIEILTQHYHVFCTPIAPLVEVLVPPPIATDCFKWP